MSIFYITNVRKGLIMYQTMNTYKSVEVQRHTFLTLAHQLHVPAFPSPR